ncbi:hypothetical protein ACFP51_28430 [Streptomyces pratens]|uniref:Uncharacterized protein n=1 Tax=Streptomyces pratens TaxID=887456 RepID=A0ABW1LXJ6_9ACTN
MRRCPEPGVHHGPTAFTRSAAHPHALARPRIVATEEVIRAARDLLPAPGRSITSIAKLLGVSPGTLCHHVPDLRAMCQGCHLHYGQDHQARTRAEAHHAALEASRQPAFEL